MTDRSVRAFASHVSGLFIGLVAVWALLVSSAGVATDKVVLQLKWWHQFQFAGYYAAQQQGYYADEGLDVEFREVEPGESAAEAVLAGKAQFGIADSSLVLQRLRGEPVVVLATIFQHSPLVFLTLESSGILGPLELRGKRVMFRKDVDDAVLLAMFIEMGVRESDFTQVPQSFREESLLGDVDAISAYTTNQPYYFRQRGIPVNIISPANYGIDFYGDMLFTTEDYFSENADNAVAFRRASLKGWSYALDHPGEVIDWMLANLPVKKTRDHLLFEAERTARLIQPDMVEIGYFSERRFWRIADTYRQLGMAPVKGELSGLNYNHYLDKPVLGIRWLYVAGGLLSALALLLIVLGWLNRRLQTQVRLRTREIEKANASLEQYNRIMETHVAACSVKPGGAITSVSEAFCRLTGYTEDELIGKPMAMLNPPGVSPAVYEEIRETMNRGETWSGEMHKVNRWGQDIFLEADIEPHIDAPGRVSGYTAIYEDITDKKRILELSTTDSLTGLPNRRMIDESLHQQIEHAARYDEPLAVVLFDVDHFKTINDSFGHTCGDTVLRGLASLVANMIRKADIAGRWGGEEFILVCPQTDLAGAQKLAGHLRSKVENWTFFEDRKITCSFGVALWRKGETTDGLFQRADRALYQAKAEGRNRVVSAD